MPQKSEVNLFDLTDLCTPWCIHVVATLDIAGHIAAGIDRIDDLAKAAGCDPTALHQVLGHLIAKGVFEEIAPGQFSLNDAARQLLDPSFGQFLNLDGIGGRMAYAWGTLLDYVRRGEPAYSKLFGLPFWEDLDAHPNLAADFDALIGPSGHGAPDPEIRLTGGWGSVRTVVDVGGGTGAMLAEILRAHPEVRGTLVDLPRTVARSGSIFHAAGVAERASISGQSFFELLPPGADLYLLRGVLNDWPDREAVQILQRCAEAARPDGRVVVLKSVGPDNTPKDLRIEMVLLGGKNRTITEFRGLAQKAGLEVIAAGQQSSSTFMVECRPT